MSLTLEEHRLAEVTAHVIPTYRLDPEQVKALRGHMANGGFLQGKKGKVVTWFWRLLHTLPSRAEPKIRKSSPFKFLGPLTKPESHDASLWTIGSLWKGRKFKNNWLGVCFQHWHVQGDRRNKIHLDSFLTVVWNTSPAFFPLTKLGLLP